MEWNLLANVPNCENYAFSRAKKFMIYQVKETVKDYKFEAKSKNSFPKRQLEERRKEMLTLKQKCKHIEDMINYLKSLLVNQTRENSSIQSSKN